MPPATHSPHPYSLLQPEQVLAVLDALGVRGDGRILQLNSFENRVFQVFLEDGGVRVAKFYRPGRWSDAQIAEEHAFALELQAAEVPVVAPLPLSLDAARDDGPAVRLDAASPTLAHARLHGTDFRVAVYPRRAGHGPELDDPETLQWLGRFIGRLHAVGAQRRFEHRRRLDVASWGAAARELLLGGEHLPQAQRDAWRDACDTALGLAGEAFERIRPRATLRLHGDCHPGNILWRDEGPHVVDLDDAVTGPAVQDLWMLVSGNAASVQGQLGPLLAGYRLFMPFDERELALVEPLRTLRMVHHSAWLAQRWQDPAFPVAFPFFGTPAYWSQQTTQLREQIELMADA